MVIGLHKKICTMILLIGMYNFSVAIDIREFSLEFPQNKQDEEKNTFLHHLAYECENFEDWSELMDKVELFMDNNKQWMPNPFIQNNNGVTARQQAKKNFKKTGNPVCGFLVIYLQVMEYNGLNQLSIKKNREATTLAQQLGVEHPAGRKKQSIAL